MGVGQYDKNNVGDRYAALVEQEQECSELMGMPTASPADLQAQAFFGL